MPDALSSVWIAVCLGTILHLWLLLRACKRELQGTFRLVGTLVHKRDELRETLAAQPQWIPVTDRLPESGIPVLIVIDGTVYRGAYCAEGTVECDEDDDGAVLREDTDTCERAPGWYWCDSLGLAWVRSLIPGMFDGPPTHWMPMPSAPQAAKP